MTGLSQVGLGKKESGGEGIVALEFRVEIELV